MSDTVPTVSPNDLIAEGLIDLAEAADDFKDANGRKSHLATFRRWAKRGCRGHRLETTFFENRLMTSHRAAARFLAVINGQPVQPQPAATSAASKAGQPLDVQLK